MTLITHLPIDLITDIFARLPTKAVVRLKIVCKSWYSLIRDDDFVNHHLQRSLATKTNLHYLVSNRRLNMEGYDHLVDPFERCCPLLYFADFDSLQNPIELSRPFKHCKTPPMVSGLCRGLVLIHVDDGHYMLYNPTTQTYNLLPPLRSWKSFDSIGEFDCGFGYDTVSRDYKCVRIFQCRFKEIWCPLCEVLVYSMKTNSWKRVADAPFYFRTRGWVSGTLVHQVYHWIGTNSDGVYDFIVAFSFRDEAFSCLPLPSLMPDLPYEYSCNGLNVGTLDDCLCLVANRYPESDLWVMKEYGVAASWTRMFTFSILDAMMSEKLIGYSMDRKSLVFRSANYALNCFDLETMTYTELSFGDSNRVLDVNVCVENLLMLDYAEFLVDIHTQKKRRKRKNRKRRRRRKNKNREPGSLNNVFEQGET